MDAIAIPDASRPLLPPGLPAAARDAAEAAAGVEADRELLFAVLAHGLGCMGAAEAADVLLARYGSLAEAVAAEATALAALPQLGEGGAAALKAVHAAALHCERLRRSRRPVLGGTAGVLAYLRRGGARGAPGEMRALFLDGADRLLADEIVGATGPGAVAAVPARALRRALALQAAGMVLVRAAPGGGDPVAGAADIAMARSLDQAARVLEMRLRDLLVVGPARHASLRERGLLAAG